MPQPVQSAAIILPSCPTTFVWCCDIVGCRAQQSHRRESHFITTVTQPNADCVGRLVERVLPRAHNSSQLTLRERWDVQRQLWMVPDWFGSVRWPPSSRRVNRRRTDHQGGSVINASIIVGSECPAELGLQPNHHARHSVS